MNKAKFIFNQALMISTSILFCMGVRTAILFFTKGIDMAGWEWYVPLSIVIVGFLCAPVSLLLLYDDQAKSAWTMRLRICLHCLLVFGIVSLSGYLFHWYSDLAGFLVVALIYIIIYVFVWIATTWILKADEKKINDAIDQIRDEE
ncbi:MAG: DUF3021 domain-containing protein [Lachnospiraceae bacterium]|nr:DUF3021 domain-containing protein [Lachnospiraceae bacterium]